MNGSHWSGEDRAAASPLLASVNPTLYHRQHQSKNGPNLPGTIHRLQRAAEALQDSPADWSATAIHGQGEAPERKIHHPDRNARTSIPHHQELGVSLTPGKDPGPARLDIPFPNATAMAAGARRDSPYSRSRQPDQQIHRREHEARTRSRRPDDRGQLIPNFSWNCVSASIERSRKSAPGGKPRANWLELIK